MDRIVNDTVREENIMPVYQVMRDPAAGSAPDSINASFIREGFSPLAFFLPPVWALVHRLWLELLVWIVLVLILWFAGDFLGVPTNFFLYVLFATYIGYDAAAIRIRALRRKGHDEAGHVVAQTFEQAQMEWLRREDGGRA